MNESRFDSDLKSCCARDGALRVNAQGSAHLRSPYCSKFLGAITYLIPSEQLCLSGACETRYRRDGPCCCSERDCATVTRESKRRLGDQERNICVQNAKVDKWFLLDTVEDQFGSKRAFTYGIQEHGAAAL